MTRVRRLWEVDRGSKVQVSMVSHPLAPLAHDPLGPASLLVALLAVLALMPLASGPRSPEAPRRIVSLELARSPETACDIALVVPRIGGGHAP